MMTRLVFAFALSASIAVAADEVWFDAGIESYGTWPHNGAEKVLPNVGTWSNTASAGLVDGGLAVESGVENALEFTPAAPREISSEKLSFASEVTFSASQEFPEIDPGMKAALSIVSDSLGDSYIGIAKSASAATNVWMRLAGAVPSAGSPVAVEIAFRKDSGRRYVRYAVGGVALTSGGEEWLEIAVADDSVKIGYAGVGKVGSLSADVDAPTVAVTIPDTEGMTVKNVKVGGVVVPIENGVYKVARGALVAVSFTPESGYELDRREIVFTAEADLEIAQADMPVATIRESVFINEVMASNKSSLKTAGGVAGLDWIEIRNTGSEDVDLAAEGWLMTDDPTKKISKWKPVEGKAVVPAGGYLIVWADKDFSDWHENDAHVAFGLSGGGESVGLAKADGHIASSFDFGQQFKDVSYGWGRPTRTIITASADAKWRVGAGQWNDVKGPLGMSSASGSFKVVSYQRATTDEINSVTVAKELIEDPSNWSGIYTNYCETLAFQDGDNGRSEFPPYSAFPGVKGDRFVLKVTGTVNIPEAGDWTFSVGSDDGFSCKISGHGVDFGFEYTGTRGYNHNPQNRGCFNFPVAGAYDIELIYFENGGGASLDFSVARGSKTWDANQPDFALVGSETSEVVHTGAFNSKLAVDVAEAMVGVSDSVEWQSQFTASELPEDGDTLRLRIRYSDGFTASLNGTEFAHVSAQPRSAIDALSYAYFDIPAGLVREGENVLAVTGLNNSAADTEFFLSPEVLWTKDEEELLYFESPTPLAANRSDGKTGITPAIVFSEPHGWKTSPFSLELSCPENPAAQIRYTLDGTSPDEFSELYTGPIAVSKTTAIRAAVLDPNTILQKDCSATYLFVEDVVRQGVEAPEGFPETRTVNNQKFAYGMAQNIANGADGARLREGFTNSICTISLVIDPKNLFDPYVGIYVNAQGDGRLWERQTMVEQIDPVNGASNEFSVPAGLRIRGAYSRNSKKAKHSLRLFFRSDYGMSTLEHPLFGDEGAGEFEVVDLRTTQNFAWSNEDNDNDTFIHECFSRDSQRDMGTSYARSRYYNLFINGVYWGLYQTEERASQSYAASYYGGDEEDYDVVRTSQPGYVTGIVDGDDRAWSNLWEIAVLEGFAGDYTNNYKKVLGLNPDGTRNENYPVLVNERDLMAYMLTAHYTGDTDCPSMSNGEKPNNICAFYGRTGSTSGFRFNRHDAEHSMEGDGKSQDTTLLGTEAFMNGSTPRYDDIRKYSSFNPAELQYRLLDHPEYKMHLADFFYREVLRKGGAMTLEKASARFMSRMAELDDAIVCESARWGFKDHLNDNDESQVMRTADFAAVQTRQTWLNACRDRLNFITNRVPRLLAQYRNRGWYPSIDVPEALNGGVEAISDGEELPVGTEVRFSGTNTVYYTTDGSDPRLEGGEINPASAIYTGADIAPATREVFAKGGEWRYSCDGAMPAADGVGNPWNARIYDDSAWLGGSGAFGFRNGLSFATALPRYVGGGSSGTQVTTYYFRKKFSLPAEAVNAVSISGTVYYDDGYIIYVNGQEIARSSLIPAGTVTYSTFTTGYIDPKDENFSIDIPKGLLRDGENTIAVEVHQCNATSSDVAFDMSLGYTVPATKEGALVMGSGDSTLKFRALSPAGEWSALEELELSGTRSGYGKPSESLRFAEFCGIPADSSDGDENEWIVLTNLSASAALDVGGIRVEIIKQGDTSAKCDFAIPAGTEIPAGATRRFDQASFALLGWQKITNNKVYLRLYASAEDAEPFSSSAAVQKNFDTVYGAGGPGGGASLVATAFDAQTGEGDWRASYELPADSAGANAVKNAIKADSRVGAWLDSLVRANAAKQDEITAYTGSADALKAAYLVNLGAVADPQAELVISAIRIEPSGNVLLDADLSVLGSAWTRTLNGKIRLYRYETLASQPDVIDLDATSFPVRDALGGGDDDVFRFFKVVIE